MLQEFAANEVRRVGSEPEASTRRANEFERWCVSSRLRSRRGRRATQETMNLVDDGDPRERVTSASRVEGHSALARYDTFHSFRRGTGSQVQ